MKSLLSYIQEYFVGSSMIAIKDFAHVNSISSQDLKKLQKFLESKDDNTYLIVYCISTNNYLHVQKYIGGTNAEYHYILSKRMAPPKLQKFNDPDTIVNTLPLKGDDLCDRFLEYLKDHASDFVCIKESITESMKSSPIFAIIKPGFVDKMADILTDLTEAGLVLGKCKHKKLSLKEAQDLYSPHKDQDFYDELCEYMTSGPSIAMLLDNPKHIDMGALKEKIRKEYGKDEMRNALHSSDSPEAVERESKIFWS